MRRKLLAGIVLALVGGLCLPAKKLESQSSSVTLVGAGDIADGFDLDLSNAMATAALLDSLPSATVFANGDLAYNNGTDEDFLVSYDLTWGRERARTIPVIGDHEYFSLNGEGFFNYFGTVAGDPTQGYYSLNLGAWHIVVLNSQCSNVPGGCAAGSPQETWLKNDLAANTSLCTLALWHQPYYTSSSVVTPDTAMQPMWVDLYNANADLIVNAHAHNYERFAPQDPYGNLNTTKGIIEIVAGTGGDSLFPFNSTIAANSLVRNDTTYGVLQFTLQSSSFSWQFNPVAGSTFTDSGTQACH